MPDIGFGRQRSEHERSRSSQNSHPKNQSISIYLEMVSGTED